MAWRVGWGQAVFILTSVGLDGKNRVQRDGYFKTKTLADDIAFDGASALQMFAEVRPMAVCLDLGLPDVSGMELFDQLRRLDVTVPVLVLTADDQVATAVRAMRAGAYDYLVKPVDRNKLTTSIRAAIGIARQLQAEAAPRTPPINNRMIGDSPVMRTLFQQIERVGDSNISVLLHGESGTGKELVAHAIHHQSARRSGTFVDCIKARVTINVDTWWSSLRIRRRLNRLDSIVSQVRLDCAVATMAAQQPHLLRSLRRSPR